MCNKPMYLKNVWAKFQYYVIRGFEYKNNILTKHEQTTKSHKQMYC